MSSRGRKRTVVPGSAAPWRGQAVTRARTHMATHTIWPHTCPRCGKPVHPDPPDTAPGKSKWVIGHIKDRATHPELTWVESNWRIEHRKCSDKTGQAAVIAKAKAEALRDAGITPVFSQNEAAAESPPLAFSLSDDLEQPGQINPDLLWDPAVLARTEWLRPLLDIPEDASPPLMMTPVPDDAVGTYGWDAVAWIEETQRISLRWWQKLSIVRQLEHRADGSLCHRTKVESAPRRAGKSVGLRGGALWRMEHGPALFGETQTVIHTGSDMAICREIQKGAWRWAESVGWTVTRGNGKEQIEATAGDRWLVRAQDAVTGYDCHLGIVDEGWNVKPDTVSEGLEPATLERSSPQMVLTSTAHRRATSMMRTWLADAQAMTDPAVLLLLWAAPAGSDPGDPEVWRAASPHWSEDRHRLIASKYEKALRGEVDAELDDPDPMRGFESQYLNIWHLTEAKTVGTPVIGHDSWTALAMPAPDRVPDAVAVESWFGQGISVARAWKREDGPVVVSVADHPDLPAAVAYAASLGLSRPVLAGSSLADDGAWQRQGVRFTKMADSTRSQVGDLIRYLGERAFVHDGSEVLRDQVLTLRTSPGTDGPRLRSTGRADAVKAAMWAVTEAAGIAPGSGIDTVIVVEW